MADDIYSGSCLCGKVYFQVQAPSLWCAHCHCSLCQRAHGAAFVTWVGAAVERFVLSKGEDHLVWFDSTEDSQRGFCDTCGSTLFFRSERWPGEMHVVRSNFSTEIDRQPEVHVFWDSHVAWLDNSETIPRKN